MAVPKKRTGASAQGHRRANWKATVPATTTCKSCNAVCLTHTVCPSCGYYKQSAVSIKHENYVSPDAAKKPKKTSVKKAAAKKTSTKPAVKKEEKAVEEAVVETTQAVETETAEVVETPSAEVVEPAEEKE